MKDIEVLIKNGLFRNKSLLADKSNDGISRKKITCGGGWKNKDFISKDLLKTIKEIKANSISVQPIPSSLPSSEPNLIPAKNSVVIEDVHNNNDEIADTNGKIN